MRNSWGKIVSPKCGRRGDRKWRGRGERMRLAVGFPPDSAGALARRIPGPLPASPCFQLGSFSCFQPSRS